MPTAHMSTRAAPVVEVTIPLDKTKGLRNVGDGRTSGMRVKSGSFSAAGIILVYTLTDNPSPLVTPVDFMSLPLTHA